MSAPKPLWKFTFEVDGKVVAEKYQRVTRRGLTRVMNNFWRKHFSFDLHEQGKSQRYRGQYIEG